MQMPPSLWFLKYEEKQAFWVHDGNPLRPHALHTNGDHSNGYFNSELVMEDTELLHEATLDLVTHLMRRGLRPNLVSRVVGPALGAITLAHDVARHIGRERSRRCLRGFTEKRVEGGRKFMVFDRTKIEPGERILIVEDVITTGKSVEMTAEAVLRSGGEVLPFVGALVNRSGLTRLRGMEIVSLIDRYMPAVPKESCTLCARGSEAIRPKEIHNWSRLTYPYDAP